ncbi:cupin domain-containing protein [Alistipes senegalensis]|uniref:cupin domain-containing protein n=1 Tax=Alistipes senegalensis TaxID=1288121 RepID=UPI0018A92C8D|nr:hypothetical protein [Alistipes senegalensis]
MNLIDRYDPQEAGYNPFLIGPVWQTAVLNYAPEESLEQIEKLDVHHHTDELFVLLEGKAVLIAAEISGNGIVGYDLQPMQPGIAYNIRREVWHKIAMTEGCRVLIVENSNTHLGDFEFRELNMIERRTLCDKVASCLALSGAR